jgi:virginiamycin B lyase
VDGTGRSRPHDPAVAADGYIWYTGQTANTPAGAQSRPYGMTSTSDGTIWYSESGIEPNTVVRFDPSTGRMQSWPIPSGGGIARHMVTVPNDDVWMACSGIDRMARVRVVRGERRR